MFLEELPLRGLLDRGEKGDVSGGAPAARSFSVEGRKMMFLDRSSRCAGLLDRGEIGDVSGGSSRCAELLGRGEKGDVSDGGAPAARGCSVDRGRRLLWGGELPLRRAAR